MEDLAEEQLGPFVARVLEELHRLVLLDDLAREVANRVIFSLATFIFGQQGVVA